MAGSSLTVGIIGNVYCNFCAEADWANAFAELGHEVLRLDEGQATEESVVKLAELSDFLLIVLSQKIVLPEWVRAASEMCLTVGWHPDLFHGLRRDGKWRESALWACDLVCTADGGSDLLWSQMGVRHEWLLPGVRRHWVEKTVRPRNGFVCDVAFVGNNGSTYHPEWPYRSLLNEQLRLICRRNGWSFMNPGGTNRKLSRGLAMNRFYASARVTVGDSLCFQMEKSLYWSDRVYEATGRNGLLVMPQINALDNQFAGALPMYRWGDWDHLESILAGFLASEEKRQAVRAACHSVTASQHTYHNRAESLLALVEETQSL